MSHRTRLAAITIAIAATALQGCAGFAPTGWGAMLKHDSALLVDGHDSQGRLREDSLDVAGGYLWWERPTRGGGEWYIEAGAGYKWREGGFEDGGKPVIGHFRVDRRFRFSQH